MTAVMEADYSTALTLVLRYPSPPAPHLPVTFVEDAIYLRDNLSSEGGKYIVAKYSKKIPSTPQPRPPVQKTRNLRRPLSPTMKPLFQAAQFESIVQDVARNMLDRSEKWGVNRAVREAVVEVKKNVQGYQHNQQQLATTREEDLARRNNELVKRLQVQEERARQLARLLDVSYGVLSGDIIEQKEKDDALKKISHVKECLLDDARPLEKNMFSASTATPSSTASPTVKSTPSSPARSTPVKKEQIPPRHVRVPSSPSGDFVKTSFKNNSDPDFLSRTQRPRTTLAQSSFAWMLGDDPLLKHRSSFVASGKVSGGNNKSAGFVEGSDVKAKGSTGALLDPLDEGFDLGTIKKS
jgi:TBC1 domain family protein 5